MHVRVSVCTYVGLSLCLCICYIHLYVCIHVLCMHARTYLRMYVYYICMYRPTCVYAHVCVCMQACVYVCTFVCMHVCMCILACTDVL
jgi:hypothetical protein